MTFQTVSDMEFVGTTERMSFGRIRRRISRVVDAVRRPEYIGPNRCHACTVVNVAIAGLLGLGAATVSPSGGLALVGVSLVLIYFRGYLVPGTPRLTKRYFPDWLLRRFDTDQHFVDENGLDGEALLLRTGAIMEHDLLDDLMLTPTFELAWYDRIDELDGADLAAEELATLLGVEGDRVDLNWNGNALVAWHDGQWLGQWESRGAFLADVAATIELEARYDGWTDLPLARQSQTLGLLRLFLERCPTCDGEVVLGQDVVESCCRSIEVVAATCRDCNDRLFEAPCDPDALEAV